MLGVLVLPIFLVPRVVLRADEIMRIRFHPTSHPQYSLPPNLGPACNATPVPLASDAATDAYLDALGLRECSSWLRCLPSFLTHWWKHRSVQYMHLFSSQQLQTVLRAVGGSEWFEAILEVGAGDGDLSEVGLHPLLLGTGRGLRVTETDPQAVEHLHSHGYNALGVDLAAVDSDEYPDWREFELTTIINVLDRCERPYTLLRNVSLPLALNLTLPDGNECTVRWSSELSCTAGC